MYFNYHAKIKKLIKENHLVSFQFVKNYHNISPALVLLFDNHPPMPVRKHKWQEYVDFCKSYGISIQISDNFK